jgi:hypothetical protein
MALRDHVGIARRFQRAIRIDSDLRDPQALEGFICPPSSAEVLIALGRHVAETRQSAFTWTGPYGSGKSSLVIALSALLSGEPKKRLRAAQIVGRRTANRLWKLLPPKSKGWCVLPVIGRREAPAVVIGDALVSAGLASKPKRGWNESSALEVMKKLASESPQTRGGLIIFIDEMGKFLEGAAAENTDINIFQQMAELAARSRQRLIIVGILHQAFEEYAHRVSRDQRDEWAKIQGRFVDLAINAAGEEQLDILARAIESDRRTKKPSQAVRAIAKCISANRRGNESSLTDALERCWPLHPVVATLLGPVSRRRFGQNQRSLFGFLNSAEPYGFQDFLRDADDAVLYTPDKFWDYLRMNLESSILSSPDGHRWSLAVEAVERCEASGGDELHLQILKALALIDLFKERSGLSATEEVLTECAHGYSSNEIKRGIKDLVAWSLALFKRHLGAYAIYAGSDFDIDQALSEALRNIKEIDIRALRSIAAFHPIIAKRHYHGTGALRWFDVDLVPLQNLVDFAEQYRPTNGSMGIFLVPIPTDKETSVELKRACRKAVNTSPDQNIIVGASPHANRVVELAREVLALTQIQQERPELGGDSVARRELLARLADVQEQLERVLGQILKDARWYRHDSNEEAYSSAALSALASDMADERFPHAPRISNELLNRLKPSSNAVSALKSLLQAMALKKGEARLGIQGFPAEGGLYASILEATGLYRETEDGWQFVTPGTDGIDPAHLAPLWQQADDLLQSANRLVGLEELYSAWRSQPYGVKDGIMPILAVSYILSRRDNLAFYRQRIFQARFGDLDIDYLAKDPRDIQFRWLDLNNNAEQLLLGMAEIVREFHEEQKCTALRPIDIARGLVAAYEQLEPWTKRTTRLSTGAVRIRDILKRASDPNRLILDDIPALVGADVDLANAQAVSRAVAAVRAGLEELRARYRNMLDELRKLLLKELLVHNNSTETMDLLRDRARNVQDVSGDFRLNAFIGRLAQFQGTDQDVEGLASLASNKPPRDWTDPDLNQAALELAGFAQQFIRTEAFARVKGRDDKRHAMAVVVAIGGQPTPRSHEFSVTEQDRSAIEDLIYRVELTLKQVSQQEKHVILAALAELSARFMKDAADRSSNARRAARP